MSPSFGAGASRLAGLAAQWLGWRPDEFWRATPAELSSALTPPVQAASAPLRREELNQMMEHENG